MEQSDTLTQEGKTTSIGNIKKTLGYGSNRDITKHRRALLSDAAPAPAVESAPDPVLVADDDPVYHTRPMAVAPEPDPPPPSDPVERARARCEQAELDYHAARDTMDEAVDMLEKSRGKIVDGERFGGWSDPASRDAVKEYAKDSTHDERNAWQALLGARADLDQMIQQDQRRQRDARMVQVATHLVAALQQARDAWDAAQRDRSMPDRQRDLVRAQWRQAEFVYQTFLLQLDVPTNGTTYEKGR